MDLTDKQKIEQAEAMKCTAHIRTMLTGVLDDGIGIHMLIYCLEIEVHRLKTVILNISLEMGQRNDAGGMYR